MFCLSTPPDVNHEVECAMPTPDPKTEVRRERFRAHCRRKGWFDEGRNTWVVTEIAKASLKPTNKVSDLLNGKGSFGAKIARELEVELGLPEFALEAADAPEPAAQDSVAMTFDPIRPPTAVEAFEALGEAIASLDDLGLRMVTPVLDSLLREPERAAELGQQFAALVEMRRRPPPGSPKPTRKKTAAAERKAPEKARLTVTEGGGNPAPQLGLRLPLRTVADPFEPAQAPKKEREWYEKLPKAPARRSR
jgi:hypothetical protein